MFIAATEIEPHPLLLPSEVRRLLTDDYDYDPAYDYDQEDLVTPPGCTSPSDSELRYTALRVKLTDVGGAYDGLKSLLRFYWKSLRTLEPYQLSIIDSLHERYLVQTSALGSIQLAEVGDVLSDVSLLNEVKVSKGGRSYEYHCIYVGVTSDDTPRVFVKVHSATKTVLPGTLVVKLVPDEELYAGRALRFAI